MPLPLSPSFRTAVIIAFVHLLTATTILAKNETQSKTVFLIDLLRPLQPASNTEAIATRAGFVLQGIQTGAPEAEPQAGDTVTALVELMTLDGKQRPTQWIIQLQLAQKISTDSDDRKPYEWIEFTNTGDKFVFHSDQTTMKLESLGPIKADTKPDHPVEIKRQEIFVATDFLSLDLSRAAQVIGRVSGQPKEDNNLSLQVGPKSFPDSEVNVQRPRATALKLTSDDLRSFSGSLPALKQFLDIMRSTPDLQDILYQVLDKPSLIDVLRSGATTSINFNFLGGRHAPGREIFWPEAKHEDFSELTFELYVFKKPVLLVTLFVTTPRPPLLVSAGIVGIVAFKPKAEMSDKVVVVRVLSATAGSQPILSP